VLTRIAEEKVSSYAGQQTGTQQWNLSCLGMTLAMTMLFSTATNRSAERRLTPEVVAN
jgi:hypothetical protein